MSRWWRQYAAVPVNIGREQNLGVLGDSRGIWRSRRFRRRGKKPGFSAKLADRGVWLSFECDFLGENSPPMGSFNHAGDPISTRQTPFSTRPEAHFRPPKPHFHAFLLNKLWYVPQLQPITKKTRLVFPKKRILGHCPASCLRSWTTNERTAVASTVSGKIFRNSSYVAMASVSFCWRS